MSTPLKIAVSTSGGDAPGLNAAVRAVALAGQRHEVWGIRSGYRGLLEPEPGGLVRLDRAAVAGIGHLGGTILGAANRGDPFRYPRTREGKPASEPLDRSDELVALFRQHGFDALVAIGGDGTMKIARALLSKGLPRVIGVPKTIDNDVLGTDMTFGFDTASSVATEALDRLHPTAEAHERVLVVEVMGRHAGHIALRAGLAGGADVILLPEIPYALEPIVAKLEQRWALGREFAIVVVSEGARPRGGEPVWASRSDPFRAPILGGVSTVLAAELAARTGRDVRPVSLGHLLRGASPTSFDRALASRLGAAAVGFLETSSASGMVALVDGSTVLVPLEATEGTRTVALKGGELEAARALGLSLGDEDPLVFALDP